MKNEEEDIMNSNKTSEQKARRSNHQGVKTNSSRKALDFILAGFLCVSVPAWVKVGLTAAS